MNARVFFPARRAAAMLAGAAALLLISATLSGPAWAIFGGGPDGNRHPNVGTLICYYPQFGVIAPFGSGILVHERVLLTSGHGIRDISAGVVIPLGVTFDENLLPADPEDPSTWFDYEVVGFVGGCREYPPGTGANPHATDIGAIILAEPVRGIQPAALPPVGLLDAQKTDGLLQAGPNGTRLTVVGYGWDLSFPPPEAVWPFEPVPVVYDGQIIPFMGGQRKTAQSGYLGLNDAWLHLNQSPAAGYGGTQSGDSGGPVFCIGPDGNEVLVGIIAWGPVVGVGFNYRIDTPESLRFIQDVIDSLGE